MKELLQSDFFQMLLGLLANIKITDILDILFVAIITYYAIRLVRETRAMQLVKSIGVVLLVYFLSDLFSMFTLKFLLGKILDYGLVVLVVLFQPELRRALERIGRSRLTDWGRFGAKNMQEQQEANTMIEAVCESCMDLSKRKEGALIVMEREIRLGEVINTGTLVDATPSPELISNIFFKNSPLHDGAMVIRNNRICAAGCYLPLSSNYSINRDLGTRHRAALGISEVSDALVIVISEERGSISVAMDSRIYENYTIAWLKKLLEEKLINHKDDKKSNWLGKFRRKQDEKTNDQSTDLVQSDECTDEDQEKTDRQ